MAETKIKIALAGNPNCGKTTLFNALTGSNQFVGNWPGVTVEKKEGRLKKHNDVIIQDLPGIYSLSPYTLEEVVSRNYLVTEKPDVILNIVDGTSLERNLYLTSQLLELNIPVVMAINMMDLVTKNGDKIDTAKLSKELGVEIVSISALKEDGIFDAAEKAIAAAEKKNLPIPQKFNADVEDALNKIIANSLSSVSADQQRWYAIKVFERDEKVLEQLNISTSANEEIIAAVETKEDDDSESIITNERYNYIENILHGIYRKKGAGELSISDKIDKIVTNRWLGLPIFALVMWIVYFVSITTVGTMATDWVNDGLFGDGWFWFGSGREEFDDASTEFGEAQEMMEGYLAVAEEEGYVTVDEEGEVTILDEEAFAGMSAVMVDIHDDEGEVEETVAVDYAAYLEASEMEEPDPSEYGPWANGLPVIIESGLEAINVAPWLQSLILDGIVAGVGAVLGFLPQMLVLFFFLAFLESCGYMARIAFVMDRIFRKFGLSGKSFIPMLIGTGCGVPGIMASRTIENQRDRKMTIITTTFIPCSAKLPVIAFIAGAFFNNSGTVATSAYFLGVFSIICSGIILKKTKLFAGDPAPFVMELPAYHWPTPSNILRSMWERGSSFVKKAGTIILLATIFIWFTSSYGFEGGSFTAVDVENSLLAAFGRAIVWIFYPLGWVGDQAWKAAVATVTGLIAKESVVSTLSQLYGVADAAENGWQAFGAFNAAFAGNAIAGYSFLAFNLLCAPCFAAIGAIRREMNNAKWTWFAVLYQCGWAYIVAFLIYQFGTLFTTGAFSIGTVIAVVVLACLLYLLFRPAPKTDYVRKTVEA